MTATSAGSQDRLTGWRAAIIWLVALCGIVAIGLGQVFNPTDLIRLLIIAEVILSAAFSGRLRNEVDLATVTADLDGTVRRSMAPAAMGVWLRGAGR